MSEHINHSLYIGYHIAYTRWMQHVKHLSHPRNTRHNPNTTTTRTSKITRMKHPTDQKKKKTSKKTKSLQLYEYTPAAHRNRIKTKSFCRFHLFFTPLDTNRLDCYTPKMKYRYEIWLVFVSCFALSLHQVFLPLNWPTTSRPDRIQFSFITRRVTWTISLPVFFCFVSFVFSSSSFLRSWHTPSSWCFIVSSKKCLDEHTGCTEHLSVLSSINCLMVREFNLD